MRWCTEHCLQHNSLMLTLTAAALTMAETAVTVAVDALYCCCHRETASLRRLPVSHISLWKVGRNLMTPCDEPSPCCLVIPVQDNWVLHYMVLFLLGH